VSLAPFPLDRRYSAAAQAYELVREWIVTGRLRPGETLSEPKMAENFGVSRTPVREVFKRLQEEGLLEIFPQVGSVVAPIDIEVVRDSQFIRETLEARTIELAVEVAGDADIATLRAAIMRQKFLVDTGNKAGFFSADDEFHEALMRMSGHRSAWRTVMMSKAQLDRVRYLSLEDADWLAMVFTEHCEIVDAVAERDAVRAVAAMRAHLRTVFAAINRVASRHPDYFRRDNAVSPAVLVAHS
jgi:DNA-binding GntR family transcriptional regulator